MVSVEAVVGVGVVWLEMVKVSRMEVRGRKGSHRSRPQSPRWLGGWPPVAAGSEVSAGEPLELARRTETLEKQKQLIIPFYAMFDQYQFSHIFLLCSCICWEQFKGRLFINLYLTYLHCRHTLMKLLYDSFDFDGRYVNVPVKITCQKRFPYRVFLQNISLHTVIYS